MPENAVGLSARRTCAPSATDRGDTVTAMMLFDCPQDDRMRVAVWFESDEESEDADGAEAWISTGTPADPAEIAAFSNHLRPCPAS